MSDEGGRKVPDEVGRRGESNDEGLLSPCGAMKREKKINYNIKMQ